MLGAAVTTVAFSVGWLLRGRFVHQASPETTQASSVQVPGTGIVVGQGTVGQLLVMNSPTGSHQRQKAGSLPGENYLDGSGPFSVASEAVDFDNGGWGELLVGGRELHRRIEPEAGRWHIAGLLRGPELAPHLVHGRVTCPVDRG